MSKYKTAKYKTFKYGRYLTVKPALGKVVMYRMSAKQSAMIIIQETSIDGNVSRIRLKSNDGLWVETNTIEIDKNPTHIRIRAIGSEQSPWVVSTKIILEEGDI